MAKRSVAVRFWAKVALAGPEDCWEWLSQRDSRGRYGHFTLNGKVVRAHRVAYELTKGPIPEGLHLDHLCRNPPCVNPAHLEAVTPTENMRRGYSPAAFHAQVTHCPKGHPYDETNTFIIKASGSRACRECRRAAGREYMRRKREAARAKLS